MGIFSFGKKDDAPRRRGANSGSGRGARGGGARVERRTRRTETAAADADAMLLDPLLPEKQRARRRLVGAIALVVAAIVVLPMVLDSHPKPVTGDIAIDIPNRPVAKATTPPEDTQAGVAPDEPPATAGVAGAPAPVSNAAARQTAQAAPATASSARSTADARYSTETAHAPVPVPAPAPAQMTESDARHAAAAAQADSGTPASPPGSRFAVQLGVFANDANARTWAAKLKAAGVPVYTEKRKQADGSVRTLLRAGPFVDRAAASAAIAKVREAGLMAGANGTAQ